MLPVAILAGGRGTRLHPLTDNLPKSLVPILGKPFLEWQLNLLQQNGISEVTICVSYKSDLIKNYIYSNSNRSLKLNIIEDGDTQLGTGGAIVGALDTLGEKFAVLYGDSYLPFGIQEATDCFLKSEPLSLMTVTKAESVGSSGNVEYRNNVVTQYRKGSTNPSMKYVDYGLNFFQREAFQDFKINTNIDLSDIQSSLAKNQQMGGFEVKNRFYEIGSFQGIRDLEKYLRGAK
jgi:MurNAc alpha-1-phosphate uridylyltransferase